MDFSDLLGVLTEADLWPAVVDGKVVLEGNQKNLTPEIEAACRENRALLYGFACGEDEGGGDGHDGSITGIKGPQR